MAGPGSVPGWLQLPCLATLHSPQELFNPTPDTSPALPSDKPAGGDGVLSGPFQHLSLPLPTWHKTRQFPLANHFHSLPLLMCMYRYGIFIYTIPYRKMLALHCCCRMSGFRHFVLCQQCYIHIASIKGDQGDGVPF